MPWIFVLVWATGFIVARYGMPHAPPFSFLAWRFALSVLAFGIWIVLTRPTWPNGRTQWLHLAMVGLLMHGGYLGGVWAAIKAGAPSGPVALLVGLQPVLTALWMTVIVSGSGAQDRLKPLQWGGLLLGLLGVLMVLAPKLGVGSLTVQTVALSLLALVAITAATIYQKRWVKPCDVRTASFVQLLAAFLPMALLAPFESESIRWNAELIGALAWSVLVLTVGGSSMLYLMIQRGAATRVTSYFYLVPPCTAVMAWFLFGERMALISILGLVLAALGVALVVRR